MNAVMFPAIKDFFLVHRQPFAEVNIVAVGTQIFTLERPDDDRAAFHFLEYLFVCKDQVRTFSCLVQGIEEFADQH